MTDQPLRYILIVVAMAALLSVTGSVGQVLAMDSGTVNILNPAPGETVSGLVTVTGTVDFADFLKYELFLKLGDEMIWAATVYSPVVNGNLARLDTRTFIDGTYQLVVRQVHEDSQYQDYAGPSFTINNDLGAPRPLPEVEPNYLYPVEGKALARVRNCSGEDFTFDYGSPEGFREAGQMTLPPKPEDYICPFSDIALTPGEYRGTAKGGAQVEAVTYSFMAEPEKVYQIIYNGPAAGANELYIGEIEGDERMVVTEMATPDESGDTTVLETAPVAASGAAPAVDTVGSEPAAEAPAEVTTSDPAASGEALAKSQAMLPVSGRGNEARTAFVIAAVIVILFLVAGGIWAAHRQSRTA